MAELQATIEISVELNRFFNVDLFQRGYYQVQIVLKTPLKPLARVEVSDNKVNIQKEGSPGSTASFKQSSVGKSRKFQVLYRNEEVDIGDIFIFKIHTLVESTKLEKNLENLDLRLEVQLWSNDEDELMDSEATMELASSRTLLLHLSPTKGLHHFLPVLFDYFHLSAMEVVIHGTIIALHQPYLTIPKSQKTTKGSEQPTLEAVYFGQKMATPGSTPSNVTSSSVRLQQAHLMHKTICNILLSAHESLQDYLQQYAALIPGNKFQLACKDCLSRLGETVMKVQGVLEEYDLIQTALTDITQLCAENVLLWAQFLEIVLKQPQVHLHLAVEHHSQRVRRFAEGFFSMDHNKSSCLSCYDPGFHGHSSLASMVKNSAYFCNLPSLSVECIELDGDQSTLPVIFEDIFRDARASQPQVYQKPAHTSTDGSTSGSSLERSASNASSFSMSSDRVTPPHLRKRLSSKKFRRSMKADVLRSQSSYHCRDTEASSKKLEVKGDLTDGATLTSYKQISSSNSSSTGKTSTNRLERTHSFPLSSSFPESPDISQPNLIGSATSSNLASAAGKPGLSHISGQDSSCHISTSNSATLLESPCVYLKQTLSISDPPLIVTSKPPIPLTAKDSMISSAGMNKFLNSASQKGHQTSNILSHTVVQEFSVSKPSRVTKEDLNSLVEDISQALGEKEPMSCKTLMTADVSTSCDGSATDVVNGFDGVLCTHKQGFGSSESFNNTTPLPAANISSQSSSVLDCGSSLPLRDQSSDSFQAFDSKSDNSALGNEVSPHGEIATTSSPAVEVAAEPSTTLIMMPALVTAVETTHDVSELLTVSNLKVTAMELLKEEYTKSMKEANIVASTIPLNNHPSVTMQDTPSSTTQPDKPSSFTQLDKSSSTAQLEKPSLTDQLDKPLSTAQLDKSSSTTQLDKPSSTIQLDNSSSTTQLATPSEPSNLSSQRAASDSDILKNCDEKQMTPQKQSSELLLSKPINNGTEKRRTLLTSSSSYPELSQSIKSEPPRLVSIIGHHTVSSVNFAQLRESLKLQMDFTGFLYSECPVLASSIPYFHVPADVDESSSGIHLIVCVHGLDGNSADLRLVRTFIEMALPGFKLDFLMSERNQQDTFADFDKMTDRLVDEILTFLDTFGLQVTRISFVGHSLGNIIIRSTLSRPEMAHLLPKLYTLLSLSGPHLGTLYNTSGLVNMGLWFMQKWKKSGSLLQLSLKDHSDPRQTFLYKLSQKPVLQNFKHVLLVGSHQDRYVPYHSSRIEICRSAQKDGTVIGAVYREMVQNILEPIIQSPHCTLIRYDVFHALPSTANTMIGRAAHIAVLDSEIFIEKFLAVTGLKYFQ